MVFPTFFNLSLNLAIRSSWSESQSACFCWLYKASPSLAAKNIINLILVLTIWWCPCVDSSLVLLEKGFAMTSVFSWQNSISLCPASFCTPMPHLPVTPGISTYQSSGKWKSKLQWDSISRWSEWLSSRQQQITNADEGPETREPLYTVGRIVNLCIQYGKQYEDSSNN